jgi:extracellular elastinolytic metalloproteinase
MLCVGFIAQAQYFDKSIKPVDLNMIQSALDAESKKGYLPSDLDSWLIESDASSKNNNGWYYYVVQTHNNIVVRNSIANISVLNNLAKVVNSKFIKSLESKIKVQAPILSASDAVKNALSFHGLKVNEPKQINFDKDKNIFVFEKTEDLFSDIKVNLVYESISENEVVLAWNVNLDYKKGSHWWNTRINASNGEFVSVNDWVTSCSWGDAKNHVSHNHKINSKRNLKDKKQIDFINSVYSKKSTETSLMAGAYRVLPYYVESPNHGAFELVTNPDDATASALGWHNDGNAFTSTRGNNVVARYDSNGNNSNANPVSNQSAPGLVFDYPYGGTTVAASTYINSSRTQLFYMSNITHDIYYRYGFDEASGNFQQNNLGNGGTAGDRVNADAQDGSGTNNANFSTPTDGTSGRMQMFLWTQGAYDPNETLLLTINNTPLAGDYTALDNNFNPGYVPVTAPITADLVLVQDNNTGGTGSTDANDGCGALTNAAALNGKIAVARRGACNFTLKVTEAQNAGALAILIINNVAGNIIMGGGDASVTIPAYSLNQADGNALIAQMSSSTVNATFNVPSATPPFVELDGDYDNGVVGHEYGHGINIRLVGGRFNSGCVNAVESMGEGWADFIGKIIQLRNVDNGIALNGTGTFVVGQAPNGQGIRPAPYSGDIANNPMTYELLRQDTGNATFTVPHGVGSVWAGILMDMAWDLIAVYGFTDDIYNANGSFGNTIALSLVVEAMKLTACDPGFVDGRNAILQADDVLYGNGIAGSGTGPNQCIIWSAFARRGVGLSANQGSTNSTSDGAHAYDLPATCTPNYLIDNGDDKIEEICQGTTSASYDFVFYEQNAYDTPTGFVATGLPAGASATFSPATMQDTGLFSMTITGIPAGATGNFPITVTPGGDATKSKSVDLVINPTNPNVLDGDTDFSTDGNTFTSFSNNQTISIAPGVNLDLRLPASAFNGTLIWTSPNGTTYTTNTVSFSSVVDGDNAVEGNWTLQVSFTNDCAPALAPQNMNFTVVIDPLLSTSEFNLEQLVLFPNPTNSIVFIKGMKTTKDLKVGIIDITGRILLNQIDISTNDKEVKVDMSKLSSGTYFITLENNDFKTIKKVVKK